MNVFFVPVVLQVVQVIGGTVIVILARQRYYKLIVGLLTAVMKPLVSDWKNWKIRSNSTDAILL